MSISFVRIALLINMIKFKPYIKFQMFFNEKQMLDVERFQHGNIVFVLVCELYMSFDLAFNHCQLTRTICGCHTIVN